MLFALDFDYNPGPRTLFALAVALLLVAAALLRDSIAILFVVPVLFLIVVLVIVFQATRDARDSEH
jgi:hypothetical protein